MDGLQLERHGDEDVEEDGEGKLESWITRSSSQQRQQQ